MGAIGGGRILRGGVRVRIGVVEQKKKTKEVKRRRRTKTDRSQKW